MPTLTVRNVTKRFGALTALSDVSAEFVPGEIHAVLGENGAGKSTLMSVISGFLSPDRGKVILDGKSIPIGRAHECKRTGIEMIHQHFTLVPEFTVEENLALARLDKLFRPANVRELGNPAIDMGARLGWKLDREAPTRRLSVGIQQRIEILKAIAGTASVLVFDEPTAVLSPDEVDELFRVLRRLKNEGKIVILIAHKLSEVLAIADRVTVLRHGHLVATSLRSEVDAEKLAGWMVGEIPAKLSSREHVALGEGARIERLTVLGDRGETAVNSLSFEIRRGEILGIGGVDGNGQVELAECLAQIRRSKTGSMTWSSGAFDSRSPKIGYIPQDRQSDGLALKMSVQDNMLVSGLSRAEFFKGPLIRARAVFQWARSLIERFSIKAGSPRDLVGSLSGGNQQKVVVSRTLDNKPELLVVVNPTRGLDIKATLFVHESILKARDGGAAIVLFSADLDELFALSDRTKFMSRGRLLDEAGAISVVGGAA
jgi:simple sugar transport system ATP-binding protein